MSLRLWKLRGTRLRAPLMFVVALTWAGACDDASHAPRLPECGRPPFHVTPAWQSDDVLLFDDEGITAVGEDCSYRLDLAQRGIRSLDVTSHVSSLFLAGAGAPGTIYGDSTFVFATSGGGIYLYSGGVAVALDSDGWEFRAGPKLSSDGRYVSWLNVFCGGEYLCGVWVYTLGTGARRFVGLGYDASWHPSVRRLVYVGGSAVQSCLVAVDPLTGVADSLQFAGRPRGHYYCPSYSRAGGKIAFSVFDPGQRDHGIWVCDLSNRTVERVTEWRAAGLSWGVRGIAYGRKGGELADGVIWLLDPDTGAEEQLTSPFEFIKEPDSWARDQRRGDLCRSL